MMATWSSVASRRTPNWVYNDLAPWNYHTLPAALGCQGWFTAKVTTLGELDAACARASRQNRRAISKSSAAGRTIRRASPRPTSASTPCTGMASRDATCQQTRPSIQGMWLLMLIKAATDQVGQGIQG